jgi:hypothetical protein
MSRVFCQQMGWWELAVLMDKYVPRLFHGVKEELVPLVELASLKQPHARALFQAGTLTPPPRLRSCLRHFRSFVLTPRRARRVPVAARHRASASGGLGSTGRPRFAFLGRVRLCATLFSEFCAVKLTRLW